MHVSRLFIVTFTNLISGWIFLNSDDPSGGAVSGDGGNPGVIEDPGHPWYAKPGSGHPQPVHAKTPGHGVIPYLSHMYLLHGSSNAKHCAEHASGPNWKLHLPFKQIPLRNAISLIVPGGGPPNESHVVIWSSGVYDAPPIPHDAWHRVVQEKGWFPLATQHIFAQKQGRLVCGLICAIVQLVKILIISSSLILLHIVQSIFGSSHVDWLMQLAVPWHNVLHILNPFLL